MVIRESAKTEGAVSPENMVLKSQWLSPFVPIQGFQSHKSRLEA